MTTTDANGIVYLQDTDDISPFHTLINVLQSGTSNALNTRIRIARVANVTERNALAVTLGASPTNPVYTHRSDATLGSELEVTIDALTWKIIQASDATNIALPLSPGWVSDTGCANMTYRRTGNIVEISSGFLVRTGSGKAVNPGIPETIATVPAGFRPPSIVSGAGAIGVASNLGAMVQRLSPSGVLEFVPYVAPGTISTAGGYGNSVTFSSMRYMSNL